MPRSKWKGYFCAPEIRYMVQKFFDSKVKRQTAPFRVYNRASDILPEFVGLRFEVHNGKTFFPIEVKEEMVGIKFGQFARTRQLPPHSNAIFPRYGNERKSSTPSSPPS